MEPHKGKCYMSLGLVEQENLGSIPALFIYFLFLFKYKMLVVREKRITSHSDIVWCQQTQERKQIINLSCAIVGLNEDSLGQ